MPSLGGWEWVILALIALLLFGGSRLAGVGRNTGRAVREFKEEAAALRPGAAEPVTPAAPASPASSPSPAPPASPPAPGPDADRP